MVLQLDAHAARHPLRDCRSAVRVNQKRIGVEQDLRFLSRVPFHIADVRSLTDDAAGLRRVEVMRHQQGCLARVSSVGQHPVFGIAPVEHAAVIIDMAGIQSR